MIPWEEIDRARVPGESNELILKRRGRDFSIRTAGTELMNSRIHGSEDALASLALNRITKKDQLRILIGGLGMGYTLAAALKAASKDSRILVSELVPAVVSWNRQFLGPLAGTPLDDPRVRVEETDVARIIRQRSAAFDVILLDVDNGPVGLTQKSNNHLYTRAGITSCFKALTPGGVLGVWSAGVDETFSRDLGKCGFEAEAVTVRAGKGKKGSRHTIWVALKPAL